MIDKPDTMLSRFVALREGRELPPVLDEEPDLNQPNSGDVRQMIEQKKAMDFAERQQATQLAEQHRLQRVSVAMQIMGMDVSKALVGYNAGLTPEDQPDHDFLVIRGLAVKVLEDLLGEVTEHAGA